MLDGSTVKVGAAGATNTDYAANSAIGALNMGWFATGPSAWTVLSNGAADASPVTTGQVVGTTSGGGPFCAIFAAAGPHTLGHRWDTLSFRNRSQAAENPAVAGSSRRPGEDSNLRPSD
jgi:hypothetical protein